jgi:hypothetical protein
MKTQIQDPLSITREGLALHQSLTFAASPQAWRPALEASPLFTVEVVPGGLRAAWIAAAPEDEPLSFPLGQVSICSGGLLLEAFSEERLRTLRCRLRGFGCGSVDVDQQRVMPIADALEKPERLLQPLQDYSGELLDRRSVARQFLTMAWTFLPHANLGGRAPYAAVHTGRGRTALEKMLETVTDEIRDWLPGFPSFDAEEVRSLLFPQIPAAAQPEPSHGRTVSARQTRSDSTRR